MMTWYCAAPRRERLGPRPDPRCATRRSRSTAATPPDSTRAVAVPIYQTVAHDFIDADHAGAIMDLETRGFHYNRINNPTVDVLEQRVTALEGGVAAMAVSSGSAAVSMSVLNLLSAGDNFVSVPHALRRDVHVLRPRPPPARDRGPLLGR